MKSIAAEPSTRHGNIFALFQETAARMGDRVALIGDGGRGEVYSYRQVADLVVRLAAGLRQPEFTDCERMGLLSENRPEWVIAYLAILAVGKAVVPIDANLKQPEIDHIIGDSNLKLVFVSGSFEAVVHSAYPHTTLLSFEKQSAHFWRRIERNGLKEPVSPSGPAALIYTSGTTGTPKVAVLTHRNLLSNLEGVAKALQYGVDDVFLSVLPLHHTFETTADFLAPLTCGARVAYARSLKSKEILEDLGANRVTIMCGVPLLFEKMYQSIQRKLDDASLPRRLMFRLLLSLSGFGWKLGFKWGKSLFRSARSRAGLGTIRMLVSGGAPLPPEIAKFFNLIGVDFLQGYGLTECSPVVAVNRPDDIRFGSVGPPLPNLQIRILDPDEFGIGEILVKGDSVMAGYLDNPRLNGEVFRGGWFYTGDLGHLTDNHLWITGRKKNVIVSAAGKNIHPEELEEKLAISPYIQEVVVYGRKKESRQGEEVRAIIVPHLDRFRAEFGEAAGTVDSEPVTRVINHVVAELNQQVADFKRIVGFDLQLQELEKTSTKKIRRSVYAHQVSTGVKNS